MTIRLLTDLDELLAWRREVIANVFGCQPSGELMAANEDYYRRHVPGGTHLAFVAEESGLGCGCGSLCLTEELPSPDNPSGRCAYLMNIYVKREFRNHGIAHALVSRLIEEALGRNCGKIYLESTEEGRQVYESLGFGDMPDMMKYHEKEV